MLVDLEEARARIESGEVVSIPTDTVYGLAARPDHSEVLFLLKKRPKELKLIHLIADVSQIVYPLPDGFEEMAERSWPGAVTLIIPVDSDSLGYRVPDCEATRTLLKLTGPLAVTSANLSGHPPALTPGEVEAEFGEDFPILEGGGEVSGTPSKILKWEGVWKRIR